MSPRLTLHLGAHRTGTTALQKAMRAASQPLGAAGVQVWGPSVTRAIFDGHVLHDPAGVPDPAATDAAQRALAAALAEAARDGAKEIVISDENLIGTMPGNFRNGSLYPNAPERLRRLAAILPAAPWRVVLSIRPYRAYWASAYAFAAARAGLADFDEYRPALLADSRGWRALATAIREAFPDAGLAIVPFNRRAEDVVQIASLLPGGTHVQVQLDRGGPENRAPSASQLAALRHLRAADPNAKMPDLIVRARAEAPDNTPFAPFSADELAHLDARYRDDLAALAPFIAGDAAMTTKQRAAR